MLTQFICLAERFSLLLGEKSGSVSRLGTPLRVRKQDTLHVGCDETTIETARLAPKLHETGRDTGV